MIRGRTISFPKKELGVKGGTVCSLSCPLFSFSLCSSSTETSRRNKCALPFRSVWVSVLRRSNSFQSRFFANASWLIHCPFFFYSNQVWIGFFGPLCLGRSGSNDGQGEELDSHRALPVTGWILQTEEKHRLKQKEVSGFLTYRAVSVELKGGLRSGLNLSWTLIVKETFSSKIDKED